MSKTDKEITAEIVVNYLQHLNDSGKAKPLKKSVLLALIKDVHSTVTALSSCVSEAACSIEVVDCSGETDCSCGVVCESENN